MSLNGMICNLHIDSVDDAECDFVDDAAYDFVEDAGFDFNTLPARCPSGSISGSSYAPSTFAPHTPTSGRSTPPFSTSFDFGSSFASSVDSDPFGLTPPSSATSIYFPMTPNAGNMVSDFVNPLFPVTPSRGQFEFSSHPLSSCAPQLTPSQNMDYHFLINQLGSVPVLSTPSTMAQFNRCSDAASHWTYPDSPISFDLHSSQRELAGSFQSIKQEPENDRITSAASSQTTARRRALMGEARRRTTVLQQEVQKGSPPPKRTARIKREKKAGAVMPEDDHSYAVDSIEPASAYKCLAEGCSKVYRRNEHMKRHMKCKHGDRRMIFPCDWCSHVSNRQDNLEAHIKLHTLMRPKSGGKPRVNFYPGAVLQYQEIIRHNESRRRRKVKFGNRPASCA